MSHQVHESSKIFSSLSDSEFWFNLDLIDALEVTPKESSLRFLNTLYQDGIVNYDFSFQWLYEEQEAKERAYQVEAREMLSHTYEDADGNVYDYSGQKIYNASTNNDLRDDDLFLDFELDFDNTEESTPDPVAEQWQAWLDQVTSFALVDLSRYLFNRWMSSESNRQTLANWYADGCSPKSTAYHIFQQVKDQD